VISRTTACIGTLASTPGSVKVGDNLHTLAGGQGVVVFYGMAKPVRTPPIGPCVSRDSGFDVELKVWNPPKAAVAGASRPNPRS
jgi:hypothetical protein